MKPVIFLGPSMPRAEAEAILDAVYLPPVTQGDILTALNKYKPKVIGIIDGVFYQNLSVWHKEILYAMSEGVHVYGASSMGALRAAELADFGMVGVGEIFRNFASGTLNDDDEVALVYGPAEDNYRNLSDPMVNLRDTFAKVRQEGGITEDEYQFLIDFTKSQYFPDRELGNIFQNLLKGQWPSERNQEVLALCRTHYVDRKKLDAVALLEHLKTVPADLEAHEPNFDLTYNHLLEALYQRDRQVPSSEDVDIRQHQILEYASLHMPNYLEFNQNALNRAALICLASYLTIDVNEEDTAVEKHRFRVKNKLKPPEAFQAWLDANDLTEREFTALMRDQAICRRLNKWVTSFYSKVGTTKAFIDQLKLENKYEAWKEKTGVQEGVIQENYPDFKVLGFREAVFEDLVLSQMRETEFKLDTHFTKFPREAGYHGPNTFKLALFRAHLHRRHRESNSDKS